MAKFLVIRFSSIGDIVLTSPVVRCLKKQVADAEVHFLTKESFAAIPRANPYISKVHTLAHSWDLMMHELQLENYDHVIDLHHNLRTLRIRKELGIPSTAFNKLNIRKWIYVNTRINVMPPVHIVDRYMDTVSHLGVKNDGAGLDYFIPKEEETRQQDIPVSHHAGYLAIAIGAAHATKRLPPDRLKELCSMLKFPLILLGGKEDITIASEIAAIDPVRIYNACGKFSLHESADLVRKSRLLISHDTGLMHIAAALKKPVISIWGNTVPEFGMSPYYGQSSVGHTIFEVKKLSCRPCSKIGYEKCPRSHFKCMRNINLEAVRDAAYRTL